MLIALASPAAAATVTLAPRTLTSPTGEAVPYELGVLHVRERRTGAPTVTIDIAFARLRPAQPTGAPPIFFLPGGPGASYLDAFTEATDNAHRRLAMFRAYSAVAEVVVLDQRGFSRTPLTAPSVPPRALDRAGTVTDLAAAITGYARAARAANPGHDLAAYNIVECAADVDELRQALGYPRISLLGTSFGSQWSLAVMRRYPDTVSRAVLSGVEPLDAGFDMPSHVFAAMQRIAFDADRAAGLAPYLPPGGLLAAVRALHDRFARAPVTVRVPDPATGRPIALALGVGDLESVLVPDDAETWPAFVLALYHGHYEAWAQLELAGRRGQLFRGPMAPLIDASLGTTPHRRAQLESDPALALIGGWDFAPGLAARDAWPVPDLGDALRTPIQSPIPVVLVHGDWDTSTPVENTLALAPYFPAGHTMIVHRGVHALASRLTAAHPDAFAALLAFLRTGATAQIPSEITLPVPAFALPDFPPPRR